VNFGRGFIAFVLVGLAVLSSAFSNAQVIRSTPSHPKVRAQESRLATQQLIWPLDAQLAFLNGASVPVSLPLRVVAGRALLPLRELARVLGLPLEGIPGVADGVRLGKLDVYPALRLARLEGRQVPLTDVGDVLEGSLYVAARTLETAIGSSVTLDAVQRVLVVTLSRDRSSSPRGPIARFTTDKREYRIGEPVLVTEYSYDPDGTPIASLSYAGREEAYFTSGLKTISLVATNRLGRASQPFALKVRVSSEVLYSAREYARRFTPVGRTFSDPGVLTYPSLTPFREDFSSTLLVSDSPEDPRTSGLLLAETISGEARLVAYHTNATPESGRIVVMVTNLEPDPVSVNLRRFGETTATSIVAMLGQVSLLDFLTDTRLDTLRLEPGAATALYQSPSFTPGHGINTMMDLETNGSVLLETYFLEDRVREALGDPRTLPAQEGLRDLPVLPLDPNHVRGSFPNAVRHYRADLGGLAVGAAARLVIGDGAFDPALFGSDALTERPMTLLGNFGATYKITFENAQGTLGAFVPRGGPYAGAISVNGAYQPLPSSGVLYRNDLPLVLYRSLGAGRPTLGFTAPNAATSSVPAQAAPVQGAPAQAAPVQGAPAQAAPVQGAPVPVSPPLNTPSVNPGNRIELEFVPASGSFLPVNFLVYRLEAAAGIQAKAKPLGTK
jgi:hypothetical protein